MKNLVVLLFLISVISCTLALNVSQCHDIAQPIPNLTERVKIGNCKKPPCRLRKNSKIKLELKLKPDRDIENVKSSVQAFISSIPFPFPGVDGTDACKHIFTPDGKEQTGCPLKKDEEYLFKNEIDVLQIYPRLKIIVHWGLTPPDGKDIMCFEVPARITN